jgi:hypothetical protein
LYLPTIPISYLSGPHPTRPPCKTPVNSERSSRGGVKGKSTDSTVKRCQTSELGKVFSGAVGEHPNAQLMFNQCFPGISPCHRDWSQLEKGARRLHGMPMSLTAVSRGVAGHTRGVLFRAIIVHSGCTPPVPRATSHPSLTVGLTTSRRFRNSHGTECGQGQAFSRALPFRVSQLAVDNSGTKSGHAHGGKLHS